MSVDRCAIAKQIIQSCFTGDTERVTGDQPERDGIYIVTAEAAPADRAAQLRTKVAGALRAAGFAVAAVVSSGVDTHGMVPMSFRVEVGDGRSLL